MSFKKTYKFCGIFVLFFVFSFSLVYAENSHYLADQIIVKFKSSKINLKTSWWKMQANSFADRKNMEQIDTIDNSNVSVMHLESHETVLDKINQLKSDPNVEYVQPNFVYHLMMAAPNDTSFTKQRWLENTGQNVNWTVWTSGADIKRLQAMDIFSWNSNPNTTWTIVAVIDVGTNYTHTDLVNQMRSGVSCLSDTWSFLWWCLGGYDYDDNNVDPSPNGSDDHGTHVAWIIGAQINNSTGVVGINPNAKIMAIRAWTWNALYTNEIIRWINFAKNNGAKIINASRWWWGATCQDADDPALYAAIRSFSWLFVAAAGNDSLQHLNWYFSTPSDFSIATDCWSGLDNIIGVAATDQNDALASFSDYSSWSIHVGAPGVNIYSTVLNNGYGFKNGTSMATPIVAGLVSLARSMRPELSYQMIKNAIIINWDTLTWLVGKTVSGKRINAYSTLAALNTYVSPVATISYSITGLTNHSVTGSVSFNKTGVTIDNNSWSTGYLFTGNGSFIFQYHDALLSWTATATVTWIDISTVTWTITYAPSTPTSGTVIASITFNKTWVTISNNSWFTGYTFTWNESFIFNFIDSAGNTWAATATVTRIDGVAPILSWGSVTNTTSQTPNYDFISNESGTITYTGWCTSSNTTAVSWNNIITFSALANWTYSGCTLQVTDYAGNSSWRLAIPSFTVTFTPPPSWWGGWGGGGGGWWWAIPTCTSSQLMCVQWIYQIIAWAVCSSSQVWFPCGTVATGLVATGVVNTWTVKWWIKYTSSSPATELLDAYAYAYSIGITTQSTFAQADMQGSLLRMHMAKMMVNYDLKVLHLTLDTGLVCAFQDTHTIPREMQQYAILACQLHLMGVGTSDFYPNDTVTRAQFGTVLSRSLYGDTYNTWSPYYVDHLNALKINGILTVIDPTLKELRGYVMLMLMRAQP